MLGRPRAKPRVRRDAYAAVTSNADYTDARDWADGFSGKLPAGTSDWVFDYAKLRYDLVNTHIDTLDHKADDVVKYAVVGVTVLAALLGGLAKQGSGSFILIFLLPMLLSLAAVVVAMLVRAPRKLPTAPTARFAMDWCRQAKDDGGMARERVAASLHVASIGLQTIARQKADGVYRAMQLLVAALGVLVLCVLCPSLVTWSGSQP